MKTKETLSKPATAKAATAVIGIHAVESKARKFWVPLILGACLFYASQPVPAQDQQDAGSQDTGSSRGMRPSTGDIQDTTQSGQTRPDTTLDTEKMNQGSAPHTENINKDTVGPGGDNMMRDAIPGGSGLNRY